MKHSSALKLPDFTNKLLPDFYWLAGLLLLWTASWILMLPFQIEKSVPLYENVWGAFLNLFGFNKKISVTVQQTPDFLSGIISLLLILILHLRGIFTVTVKVPQSRNEKLMTVLQNLLSITVHTLFFTVIFKIFLFPQTGNSSFMTLFQKNIGIAVFVCCSLAGIVLGTPSLSKILLLLFIVISIFINVMTVSDILGLYGFFGVLFTGAGFYLEFFVGGFDSKRFLIELKLYTGRYNEAFQMIKDQICENPETIGKTSNSNIEENKKISQTPRSFRQNKIILILLSASFLIAPGFVIGKAIKLSSGYKGLNWGSTLSQTREWISSNSNGTKFRKCRDSHQDVQCYKLTFRKKESVDFEWIEFQFKNEKLYRVVERFPDEKECRYGN